MQNPNSYRPMPGPYVAVTALWSFGLTSLASACVSVFLEHEAIYNCSDTLAVGCSSSWLNSVLPIFDCGSILSSGVARPFGVPLTLFAASYYFVVVILTLALLAIPRHSAVHKALRWVMGVFGWMLLAVTLALFTFSIAEFGRLCRTCVLFYMLNLGLFTATRLLLGARRHPTPKRDGARLADRLLALILALGGLFAVTMLALLAYKQWVAYSEEHLGEACPLVEANLPETSLRIGDSSSERSLVLFIDPACGTCRTEWPKMRDLAKSSNTPVDVYLFPMDRRCQPAESPLRPHAASDSFGSCQASAALLCVQRLGLMPWEDYLDKLFMLQDSSDVRTNTILSLVPESSQESLAACLRDPTSENEARRQRAAGEYLGVSSTPWLGIRQGWTMREVPRSGRALFIEEQLHEGR